MSKRAALLVVMALSFCSVAMAQQRATSWTLAFDDPADLASARVDVIGKNGPPPPRPGREALVEPFEQLCRRYSNLRRTYLLGNCGGWIDFRDGRKQLVADVQQLQVDAAALFARAEAK